MKLSPAVSMRVDYLAKRLVALEELVLKQQETIGMLIKIGEEKEKGEEYLKTHMLHNMVKVTCVECGASKEEPESHDMHFLTDGLCPDCDEKAGYP